MLLGVNIDHIATLREARKIADPNPLEAVFILKNTKAAQVTLHLREDRRHINDSDLEAIAQQSPLPLNVECSINQEVLSVVAKALPNRITLVPENREEVTTEGGLDTKKHLKRLEEIVKEFHDLGVEVSLFIDPNLESVDLSKQIGADMIELHTGGYANLYAMLFSNLSKTPHSLRDLELKKPLLAKRLQESLDALKESANYAKNLGLKVAAGHGLNYQNVLAITQIAPIFELNIGQSIIARSVFVGLREAVCEMISLIGRE